MDIRQTHMTLGEASGQLRKHHNTVYAELRRDRVELVRENGEWWVSRDDVERIKLKQENRLQEIENGVRARLEAGGKRDEEIERAVRDVMGALRAGTAVMEFR